jgi:hypothetical protein
MLGKTVELALPPLCAAAAAWETLDNAERKNSYPPG